MKSGQECWSCRESVESNRNTCLFRESICQFHNIRIFWRHIQHGSNVSWPRSPWFVLHASQVLLVFRAVDLDFGLVRKRNFLPSKP